MPFVNIPSSFLSSSIALLLGNIKAKLIVELRRKLTRLQDELLRNCSNKKKLQELSKNLSNISDIVTKLEDRLSKINSITTPLTTILTAFNSALLILRSLPTPVPINVTDTFERLKELSKQIDIEITIIANIISGTVTSRTSGLLNIISNLKNIISSIDANIKSCTETNNFVQELPEQKTFVGSDKFFHTTSSGITYSIEIVVADVESIAPLRQAVAKDKFGITRYTGDKSFSSSTQILVDELKFIIDNDI